MFLGYALWAHMVVMCGGGELFIKLPICYTMFLLLKIPYTDIKKISVIEK